MTGTTMGRRTVVTMGVALLVGLGTAGRAVAALDKGAFKDGCQSGGGSYVENPDGSFQCNTRDGSTIKCFPNDTCISIPKSATLEDGGSIGGHLGDVVPLDDVITLIDAGGGSVTPGVSQPDNHNLDTGKKHKKHGKGRRK